MFRTFVGLLVKQQARNVKEKIVHTREVESSIGPLSAVKKWHSSSTFTFARGSGGRSPSLVGSTDENIAAAYIPHNRLLNRHSMGQ